MSEAGSGTAFHFSNPNARPKAIARWLLVVAGLVFIIVVVGGITRLTESGLSITEWKPVTGALPPLNDQDWASEFAKYQQIPEYTQINGPAGMTLADFKFIYFWEWIHRLLGRFIGLAFAFPLMWFWVKNQIPTGYKPRLLFLFLLGGMQGVVGWWMVTSGLTERTDVSHFRLATHLLLALTILAGLVWTALDMHLLKTDPERKSRLTLFGVIVLAILFVELLLGAFTAGLNAGYASNTWPLMLGKFVPPGIDWSVELLKTWSHHTVLIHFLHRWWAWIVVVALILLARRIRKQHRLASIALHCAFGTQVLLGIATVLTSVNINIAVLHQAVAALVVASTVWCVHLLGRRTANVADSAATNKP